jgi:hypothetical protein
MAMSKEEYGAQLDFLLRLNRDSVTTRMHAGYGGAVETTFDQLLAAAPPKKIQGSDAELVHRPRQDHHRNPLMGVAHGRKALNAAHAGHFEIKKDQI